jgi:polar amino acid transport system substrate-binding protein
MRAHNFLPIAAALALIISLPAAGHAGEVLDRIRQTGVLIMPEPEPWPPYVLLNDKGDFDGFDMEVFREIGRRLGAETRFVRNPDGSLITWEEQTSGQWGGKYDIVVNSMTPTAKRDENLDFPAAYYFGLGALAVHRDNTTIRIPTDASGKRIGALKSAIYDVYLRREPLGIVGMPPVTYKIEDPTIVNYLHEEEVFDALSKGDGVEIDAMVNFLTVFMAKIKEGKPFKIVGQPLFRTPQSVAILPGDPEFAAELKRVVDDMHADGTLAQLSLKWFEIDVTKP